MSQDKIKETATSTFTRYLSEHGMRKTPERYAILNKIFEMPGHFTLQALNSALDESGYHVSRSTLFNTISVLISAGMVRRHAFAKEAPVYERIIGFSHHHHTICTGCGKIREVKDVEIDKLIQTKRFGKFLPTQIDINIYGLCASCQRQTKSTARKSHNNKEINKNNEQG
ncbi:MAG: transcriptional repressor [Paramuribaculum sp.]|nr:transcriptional repressor [Paramuribaculum sp.]